MHQQNNNGNSQIDAVHPAVLQVSGEQTRRWCAAIWSVNPGEQLLIGEIRGLIQSTLVAHWMQPPLQYEPDTPAVNSFDLVFYEPVDDALGNRLDADGWSPVPIEQMVIEEYEQFEVFEQQAHKAGRQIPTRPAGLWRSEVVGAEEPGDFAWGQLGSEVAEMLDDQVWGDTPGWFSRAYCDRLERRVQLGIGPNVDGLATLASAVIPDDEHRFRWIDGMAYQALCDFVGVVVDATSELEVQWGTCPVDEKSGMAPAPLMRMRQAGGRWQRVSVGTDVLDRAVLPWGPQGDPAEEMKRLVQQYRQQ